MVVRRRLIFSSLIGVGAALTPLNAAMAQADEATAGRSWTVPAAIGLTLIAIAGLTLMLLQRRRTTEIQGRLDTIEVTNPNPTTAPAPKAVISKATDDVLRLINNPAVTPTSSEAVDLSADPWTREAS